MMDEALVGALHGPEFRRYLIDCDVAGLTRAWNAVARPAEVITTERQGLAVLHMARVHAASVPLRLRRYSAAWLDERGLGTCLPPALRPFILMPAMGAIQ